MTIRAKDPELDWHAVAERLKMIIDGLSRCYVAEGFKLDRAAGDKAVNYCRRRLAGEVGRSPRAEHAMLDFIANHGQSIDWVLRGDPTSMFCMLAASPRASARAAA